MLTASVSGKSVSVLICTRDRRDMLATLLSDLDRQSYDGVIEIIVVEETDNPIPPKGVKYIPLPVRNRGIAYARNRALAEAGHELVVYVDDDCRVGPEWLDRLLAPFADSMVVAVQGGVTLPEGTSALGWAESLLGFPGGGITRIHAAGGQRHETTEISTLNAAYRRAAILQAKGFFEAARFGGEDFLLSRQMAKLGSLQFVPEAMVRHAARGTWLAVWHWFVRRGKAEVGLWRSGLAPSGYLGFMVRSSLLLKFALILLTVEWFGWFFPPLLLLGGMVVTIWWRLRWALHDKHVPRRGFWVAPIVRLTMDLANDAGRLRALLAGQGDGNRGEKGSGGNA